MTTYMGKRQRYNVAAKVLQAIHPVKKDFCSRKNKMCSTEESRKTSSALAVPQATTNGFTDKERQEHLIYLDFGDPLMYESYWKNLGEKCLFTLLGDQTIGYFAQRQSLCWFLEPELEEQIKIIHTLVGNAVVEDHYIVVGTGSSQLYQAALYALADSLHHPNSISVVSAAPYYAAYPDMTDYLKSGLYKWAGDAYSFEEDGPYIEIVSSPNNPDGLIKNAVVNRAKGMLVHDLVYYWPQYTAITSPADYDIMLFAVSKCTGHAGPRIGWALVRDKDLAAKMVRFMACNSIGVSRDAQLRAASILKIVTLSCQKGKPNGLDNFFESSKKVLAERWKKLRDVLKGNDFLSISKFPTEQCHFTGDLSKPNPAFAWVKCKEEIDLEQLFREHKIVTRSGKNLGSSHQYTRISMMSTDEDFDLFLLRISHIRGIANEN